MLKCISGLVAMFVIFLSPMATAAMQFTGAGKIVLTQGHLNPDCRTVAHKENGTNIQRYFRIQGTTGKDDVSAVVLAALMANRDVTIAYDPAITTGCGTEPRIHYITVN